MSLSVLYVTIQFPVPSETFTAVEIRALLKERVRVSVATLKPRPPRCSEVMAERGLAGLFVDHNSIRSSLRGLWSCLRAPGAAAYLLKIIFTACRGRKSDILKSLVILPRSLDLFRRIRNEPPDIVHLYWGHYPSLLGLLILRFLPDLPVTQSLSAYDLHSRYGPGLILSRSVPVVFTLARANRQEIESLGVNPERIRVVYHGIDSETQSRNPETKHGLTVTVAERLIPLKRTDLSIRAFGLVRNSHPDAVLTILGDGPERAKLVALASKLGLSSAVRFMGHVSHGQVYDHFRKSRVFTTMSSSERLPNTVKEAMFAGCVCVVSRTVGIEELIEHGASGFIVEQEDIEAAARAISQSLVDWPSTAELRAAAAKHIENNFSSGATARRRIGIWQGLLERCQPRQLDVPE